MAVFTGRDSFQVGNQPVSDDLVPLFRQEVFKLLKSHGLPERVIENMMGWHHSPACASHADRGFNVYCGPAIWPGDNTGIENLAR
ncbi:MAG: hypothetical protein SWH68_09380 [Thermodesulfobacteriota bacterium]|nr:hypothetical protein [Thermodesulfobacteriota bacterium]